MKSGLLDSRSHTVVCTKDTASHARPVREIAAEISEFCGAGAVRLDNLSGLSADRALAILHALREPATNLILPLSVEAVLHKGVIDEAANAGCIAIEISRERCLLEGLATGLAARSDELAALILSLRRARGLGMATLVDFPLGLAGDDEGVFERGVRFFREALVAVPRISLAPPQAASSLMKEETLQNGFDWAQNRLLRHREIWRRGLWPSGRRNAVIACGYAQRRATPLETRGHYTATMEILRLLNRRRRTRARRPLLALSESAGVDFRPTRAWLQVRAASDSTMKTLQVVVEGTLDLRGARKLLDRIGEALRSGVDHVTIDLSGLDWVSVDVVTRFLEENRPRFREMANRARIVNLRETVDALRRQLGDAEGVRLLESAIPG